MAEYEEKAGKDRSQDPFRISNQWTLPYKAIQSADLNKDLTDTYGGASLEQKAGPFRQRNRVNKDRKFKALVQRFIMAMFGGITLIVPMLIMVLHKDRATDLSTTSVAVVLFAGVVAYFSEATREGIVSTVAAYAAVLMVFVGTLTQ
jgi:uncharacterized membrane protein YfcA